MVTNAKSKPRASVIGTEFKRIAKANGGKLDARAVVESARDPGSPLHGCFNWDNEAAGELYRLSQAHHMIRHYRVEVRNVDLPRSTPVAVRIRMESLDPGTKVREYHQQEQGKHEYRPLGVMLSSHDGRTALLESAKAELQAFKRKYAVLTELSGVFAEIDKLG